MKTTTTKTKPKKQPKPSDDGRSHAPDCSDSCRCLETIKTNLLKVYDEVDLALSQFVVEGPDGNMKIESGLSPLRLTYRKGKQKGKSHIAFNFCPFCGRKVL